MRVIAELFGILATAAGKRDVHLELTEGSNVNTFLNSLCEIAGAQFSALITDKNSGRHVDLLILINGKDSPWNESSKVVLHEGDRIAILLPLAGGQSND